MSESPAPSRNERLWGYGKPYIWWYLGGAFFLVLTNLAGLAIPEQIGIAVQAMRDASESTFATAREGVVGAGQLIILLAVGAGFARIMSRITIFNAGRFVEFDLRNDLYDKLTTLQPSFFGGMATGDLTSRVANDVGFVRALFAIPMLHLVNALLAYPIALQKMIAIDATLTLYCLAPYPFLLLAVRKLIIAMFEQTVIVQQHLSTISSKAQENLSGVAVVKAYVLEEREKAQFGELNEQFVEKNMRLATLRGGMQSVFSVIAGLGTLIVLFAGAEKVVSGEMELGSFVEFNGYVVALAFPTIAMGWVFSIWHRGLAAFDRIREVLDTQPEIADEDLPRIEFDGEGARIEVDDVSFSYGDVEVLHNVSLDIAPGETVAIVGKTGSGKSTLLSLLSRFADPDRGEVRIDGRPLPRAPLRDTRAEFGVVPQGPFLFSMTVGDNLRFGLDALEGDDSVGRPLPTTSLMEPGVERTTDERVEEALEMAGLASDIDGFPKGLETLVGERGITLSGGQKQRATIARALLVDPRILILDDALSSVDTKTEAAILDHLDTVMAGRTSIVVTHRFNALHRFDRVFVLEDGRIVERGTHEELLELGGTYATMYARQQIAEGLS